jgi:hypothetical protein
VRVGTVDCLEASKDWLSVLLEREKKLRAATDWCFNIVYMQLCQLDGIFYYVGKFVYSFTEHKTVFSELLLD